MNGTYVDVCNYQPTPPATEPADVIAERDIAIRWLRRELERVEGELADREKFITQLLLD